MHIIFIQNYVVQLARPLSLLYRVLGKSGLVACDKQKKLASADARLSWAFKLKTMPTPFLDKVARQNHRNLNVHNAQKTSMKTKESLANSRAVFTAIFVEKPSVVVLVF